MVKNTSKMLYVNEIGTLNLINLSLEYDSKLGILVFRSLGLLTKEVNEEDFSALGPTVTTNIYAMVNSWAGLVNHYVKNYGLIAVGIIFMVYGPG